jgi:hypothetical protein
MIPHQHPRPFDLNDATDQYTRNPRAIPNQNGEPPNTPTENTLPLPDQQYEKYKAQLRELNDKKEARLTHLKRATIEYEGKTFTVSGGTTSSYFW